MLIDRYYQTPLGDLPSVTSIISARKNNDPSKSQGEFLEMWRIALDHKVKSDLDAVHRCCKEKYHPIVVEHLETGKSIADLIRDNSIDRGNKLHELIEAYLKHESAHLDKNKEPYQLFTKIQPLLREINAGYSPKIIEKATHHPSGYAGTPDLVTEFRGKLTVFDWKNSRKARGKDLFFNEKEQLPTYKKVQSTIYDYKKQIAAYCKSFEHTFGQTPERAVIVMSVLPDRFLEFTEPHIRVMPHLVCFPMNAKKIDEWFGKFQDDLNWVKSNQESFSLS